AVTDAAVVAADHTVQSLACRAHRARLGPPAPSVALYSRDDASLRRIHGAGRGAAWRDVPAWIWGHHSYRGGIRTCHRRHPDRAVHRPYADAGQHAAPARPGDAL